MSCFVRPTEGAPDCVSGRKLRLSCFWRSCLRKQMYDCNLEMDLFLLARTVLYDAAKAALSFFIFLFVCTVGELQNDQSQRTHVCPMVGWMGG